MDFFHITEGRYRKFGNPYQFPVHSFEEISYNCKFFNGYKDCFLSSCEYEQSFTGERAYPLFMLCDFDAEGGRHFLKRRFSMHSKKYYYERRVVKDIKRIVCWLNEKNLIYKLDFSACKGFHIIIDVGYPKSIYTEDYKIVDLMFKLAFHSFHNYIKRKLKLRTIDKQVKDYKRQIRIPRTINPKCNKECITILEHHEGNKLEVLDFITKIPSSSADLYGNSDDITLLYHQFPCLDIKISMFHPSQLVRMNAVRLRRMQGFSKNEIFNEFWKYGWRDWNPEKTEYMINYYYDGGYPPRCDKSFCNDGCNLRRWKKNGTNIRK